MLNVVDLIHDASNSSDADTVRNAKPKINWNTERVVYLDMQ